MSKEIFTSEELVILHKLINREIEREEEEEMRLAPLRAAAKKREADREEMLRGQREGAAIWAKHRHGTISDGHGCCCDDCLAARSFSNFANAETSK